MNRSDAILERLFGLHPKKIDLSLGRILRLLDRLGSPQHRLPPVIHVAGTNGKGSVIAFLRAMLEADGKAVHVYTSPHLAYFHERIRLGHPGGGVLVGEDALVDTLLECERVNDGETITHFEITTAAAFHLFARHPADYLLLEVGLGGRFDATNVIDRPLASVITPVSLDHQQFLGDTLAEIAHQKSGILKRGVPAIIAHQTDEALAVIERDAQNVGAPTAVSGRDWQVHEERGRLVYQDIHDREGGLLDLPPPRLQGRYQYENAATAIAAMRYALPTRLSTQTLANGLRNAEWPARLQRLDMPAIVEAAPEGADLWLDGSHNVGGAAVLAQTMGEFEEQLSRPLHIIIGMLKMKDAASYLAKFDGLAQSVTAIPVPGEDNSFESDDLAEIAMGLGFPARAARGLEEALGALPSEPAPRVLICGSLYLAGHILRSYGAAPD